MLGHEIFRKSGGLMLCAKLGATGFLITSLLGASGCDRDVVSTPSPSQDSAPVVRISNFSPGGAANIDKEAVSSADGPTAQVNVSNKRRCEPPVVMVMAGAQNTAGGVRELTLSTNRVGSSSAPFVVSTSASSGNPNGGPTSLSIFGYENAPGNAAGNTPILLTFDGGKSGCIASDSYIVRAVATNFNNQSTTLTETVSFDLRDTGCTCL